MIRTRALYVMVSQTQTGIARMIRAVSGYPYNHVSVTLDPDLREWYSFARYLHDAPLYSGFVRESPARLCGDAEDIQVRIYRVQIPEVHAVSLEELVPQANNPDSGLIYNHFDAVANAMGFRLPVPRCHTCLSFACSLLDQEHTSIESLCQALEPHMIYEGFLSQVIPPDPLPDENYFSPIGLVHSTISSTVQLSTLLLRTVCHGVDSYMSHRSRRTVR